jgi:hypothetical protein
MIVGAAWAAGSAAATATTVAGRPGARVRPGDGRVGPHRTAVGSAWPRAGVGTTDAGLRTGDGRVRAPAAGIWTSPRTTGTGTAAGIWTSPRAGHAATTARATARIGPAADAASAPVLTTSAPAAAGRAAASSRAAAAGDAARAADAA